MRKTKDVYMCVLVLVCMLVCMRVYHQDLCAYGKEGLFARYTL